MRTDRGSGGRGAQACEIQNMTQGVLCLANTELNTLDGNRLREDKRVGRTLVTTDQRMSTNSNVRRYVIMQQKEHKGRNHLPSIQKCSREGGRKFKTAREEQSHRRGEENTNINQEEHNQTKPKSIR